MVEHEGLANEDCQIDRVQVALAKRMAVTLYRMWVDEQDFRWSAA